jgi:dipeptidase
VSPHRSPVRPICCDRTHRTTIVQQRSWLPPGIGTLVWRALEPPCMSVYVPWYLGITRIPKAFQAASERADTTNRERLDYHFNTPEEIWKTGLGSSGEIFKLLGDLVDENYRERIGAVRRVWDEFEARELEMQRAVEETFLKLYRRDRALAREFITLYSNALALRSLEEAKALIETFTRAGAATEESILFEQPVPNPGRGSGPGPLPEHLSEPRPEHPS